MEAEKEKLMNRLDRHPHIKARLEALLNLAENVTGSFEKADDVEAQLIIEVRKMGGEVLQSWAVNQEEKIVQAALRANDSLIRHSKKNSTGEPHLELSD